MGLIEEMNEKLNDLSLIGSKPASIERKLESLAEIWRVIRYSITGKAKCYEIVRILEGRILMAEDSYQIPSRGEEE